MVEQTIKQLSSPSEDKPTALRDDNFTVDGDGQADNQCTQIFNDPPPVDVEFANEKLRRIEGYFQKLAPIMAKLAPLLLAKDRRAFSELECQAKEQMLKIDAALISFEAKVKSEYASMPLSWKLVLWFLSFLSARARKICNINRHAHQQKEVLLSAAEKYRDLMQKQAETIENARYARIDRRVNALLAKHEEYQELLKSIPDIREKRDNAHSADVRYWMSNLIKINERMEQIRVNFRQQLLNELEEDNDV